jgi:hypothetical protein
MAAAIGFKELSPCSGVAKVGLKLRKRTVLTCMPTNVGLYGEVVKNS